MEYDKLLAEYLVRMGYALQEDIDRAVELERTEARIRLIRHLLQVGMRRRVYLDLQAGLDLVTPIESRARSLGLTFFDLTLYQPEPHIVTMVGEEVLRRLNAVPAKREGDVLYVVMEDPLNEEAIRELEAASGCTVRGLCGVPQHILGYLDLIFPASVMDFENLVKVYEEKTRRFGIPFVDLTIYKPEPYVVAMVAEEVLRRINALPVKREQNALYVAMEDPLSKEAIRELEAATGCTVRGLLAVPQHISASLDRFFSRG